MAAPFRLTMPEAAPAPRRPFQVSFDAGTTWKCVTESEGQHLIEHCTTYPDDVRALIDGGGVAHIDRFPRNTGVFVRRTPGARAEADAKRQLGLFV
jgi:hypothetical protein